MVRLPALILLLAYVLVFLNTNAARAYGVTKITVTHLTAADHTDSPDSNHKPCPKPHEPHSPHAHELAIGGHAVHTPQDLEFPRTPVLSQIQLFSITHVCAPSGPSLLGIFRPPIA